MGTTFVSLTDATTIRVPMPIFLTNITKRGTINILIAKILINCSAAQPVGIVLG